MSILILNDDRPSEGAIDPAAKRNQAGFTLIETMVTLVISLIILAAVMQIASKVVAANSAVLRSAKLNQDLGAVIQVMVDDIRRAGYIRCEDNPITTTVNECCTDPAKVSPLVCPSEERKDMIYQDDPSSTFGEDLFIENTHSCILYSYNRDSDNKKDRIERNGFKLENGQIKVRRSCPQDSTIPDSDYNAAFDSCSTDCSLGLWEPLSDDDNTNVPFITKLHFSSTDSKCQEITHHDNIVSGSKLDNYWISIDPTPNDDSDDPTEFPCNATSGDNIANYVQNDDGIYELTNDEFVPAGNSDRTIETRQTNITLEGKVNRDFDDSASVKELEVAVKVRNDRIRTH